MPDSDDPIITSLRDKIREIEKAHEPTNTKINELQAELVTGQEQIERYEAAIAVLEGKSTTARAARGSGLTADEIVAVVKRHKDGINATEVAEIVGVAAQTVRNQVDALVEKNKIRSEGKARGRKLYPK